jgi:hypothetical protein
LTPSNPEEEKEEEEERFPVNWIFRSDPDRLAIASIRSFFHVVKIHDNQTRIWQMTSCSVINSDGNISIFLLIFNINDM